MIHNFDFSWYITVYIKEAEIELTVFFNNSNHEVKSLWVSSCGESFGEAHLGLGTQTLDSHYHRSATIETHTHDSTSLASLDHTEVGARHISDRDQSFGCHLKDRSLICRAKSVFLVSQKPVMTIPITLEITDYIDNMLQIFRSGNLSSLGHMSDEKSCTTA